MNFYKKSLINNFELIKTKCSILLFIVLVVLSTSCHRNDSHISESQVFTSLPEKKSKLIESPVTPKTFNGAVWLRGNGENELSIFLESSEDDNSAIDLLVTFQQTASTPKISDQYFKDGRVTLHDDHAVVENRTAKPIQRYVVSLSDDIHPYLKNNSEFTTASIYRRAEFYTAQASKTFNGKPISSFLKKGNGYDKYSTVDDFMQNGEEYLTVNEIKCAAGGEGSISSELANKNGAVAIISKEKGYYTCCYYQVIANGSSTTENEYTVPRARCLKYP